MEHAGIDFNSTGSVMSKSQLEEQRHKRGECLTCGTKCYQKKLFSRIPITEPGKVLNGRCLTCKPLGTDRDHELLPAVSRPATRQDMEAFTRSQSRLHLIAPGERPNRSMPNATGRIPTNPGPGPPARANSVPITAGRSGSTVNPGTVTHLDHNNRPIPSELQRSMSMRPQSVSTVGVGSQPDTTRSTRSMENLPYVPSGASALPPIQDVEPSYDGLHQGTMGIIAARRMADRFRNHQSSASENLPVGTVNNRDGDFERNNGHSQYARDHAGSHNAHSYATDPMRGSSAHSHDRSSDSRSQDQSAYNRADSQGSLEGVEYKLPVHGVLDRGGALKFDDSGNLAFGQEERGKPYLPPFSTMAAESNRTLSSMSSVEEDYGNSQARQTSRKPAANFANQRPRTAVYEDDESSSEDDSSTDDGPSQVASNRSRRSRQSQTRSVRSHRSKQSERSTLSSSSRRSTRNAHVDEAQQRALERIQQLEGDYEEIIVIMKHHPSSAMIQGEGLECLSNLHLQDDDYARAAHMGAMDAVVTGMRAHPHITEIQLRGCRAIWNLSGSTRNQILLVKAGALDVILTAMAGFTDDAEVQEIAMAAISNLAATKDNQIEIVEKGAIEKIVAAMNLHADDGNVQMKGCSAITNLSSHDSPLKKVIMDKGAGEAVVVSMIMHSEDVDLQEKALRALRNICANSEDNKKEIAKVGGIDAVISAMQVHRDEPGVQEAGAWTLSNLSANTENKAIIGDSGGIDVIIRAMWVHSDVVGVQEWCCRALWSLTVDAHNRQVVMEVGLSAIVNAMQAHCDAATVQEKGCGVLSNLAATDDDCKLRIVDEEALDAIIMAMVIHSENKSVQDRACSILRRLAIPENVKHMQAANVGELVRVAGLRFPESCGDKAKEILAVL